MPFITLTTTAISVKLYIITAGIDAHTEILIRDFSGRLENRYGISRTALSWFESYLTGRTQMVTIDNNSSKPSILCFGVPQGSVLGPVLFILYTIPLSNLIERHSISSQSFVLDSCHPDHLDTTVQRMQNCISEVRLWMNAIC